MGILRRSDALTVIEATAVRLRARPAWSDAVRLAGAITLRLLLVLLTFALVVVLVQLALVAARTRADHAPLADIIGQTAEGVSDYFGSLIGGSLGEASSTSILGGRRRAMGDLVLEAYTRSIGLVVLATATATALGIGSGVLAAAAGRGVPRASLLTATTIATAAPSFLIAAALVLLGSELNARLHIRLWPTFGFGWDDHLILPVLVLAARPLAYVAGQTFVAVEEVLREDYIHTARSRGLLESVILLRHALHNAAGPILAAVSTAVSIALSTLPVVEVFFSWPGLGFGLPQAIRRLDAATAGTFLGALAVTIALFRFGLDAVAARLGRGAGG